MTDLCGLRLLVVEDELLVALALEDMLVGFGCELVGPVSRIEEAEVLARTEALDGAILDVNVQGRMISPVAELLLARNVPVVICSGYSDMVGLPPPLRGFPHLSKPYGEAALRRAMQAAFPSRTKAPQEVSN